MSHFLPRPLRASKDLSDELALTVDQHLLKGWAEFLQSWTLDQTQTEQFLVSLSHCILEWVTSSLSYGSDQTLTYGSALQVEHAGLGQPGGKHPSHQK